MKGLKAGLVTLIAVGASALAFLVLMVGAFWALFVLPLVAFLVLTVVFAVLSSGRPEDAHRHRMLLVTPGPMQEGLAPSEPAGAGLPTDTVACAMEGGRNKP